MEPEGLKSKLLFEDSGYSICWFCSSLNIFSNQFDHYCLTSINYFLRNEARSSQKQTFARTQWAQHLLFFVLLPTSFPINLIVIVCCQSIFFSEMESEILKSEVLLEDSEYNICCFFFFLISTSQENCGAGIINGAIKCRLFVDKHLKNCRWVSYTFLQKSSLFNHF